MESNTYQVTRYSLKREDIMSAVADYVEKVTGKNYDKSQLEWCGQNPSGGFDFQIKEHKAVGIALEKELVISEPGVEVGEIVENTFVAPTTVNFKLKKTKR